MTVKESRGRFSYLTPDRTKPITARKLGDSFDKAAVLAALEQNALRSENNLTSNDAIPFERTLSSNEGASNRHTPKQSAPQASSIDRMVDREAKRAEGKGIGYDRWASMHNLKQMAATVTAYQQYGFSSPEAPRQHRNGRRSVPMPRMSNKRRLESYFFLRQVKVGNTTCDRITYNDLCRSCTHSCKQSFRAVSYSAPATTPNAGKRRTGTMADNRKYYYLKLKENFFDSDSIVLLEDMKDGILYSDILLKLYLKWLKNGGKLQLDEHIPYTAQMIATLTRHQIGTVERALEIFRQLGLVEQLDSGAFYDRH